MRRVLQGLGLCALGIATTVAAVVTYDGRGYHRPTDAGVALTAIAAPTPTPSHHPSTSRHTPTRPATPAHLSLPALAVDAPVVAVTVHEGALDVPTDPKTLGWWSGGARPGSARGSVVVVGHVDDWKAGRGALYRLEAAPMGSVVSLATDVGPLRYRIVGRQVFDKKALPADVFARTGAPRLVLITCGGPFDRKTHHYTDNVVAYGVPV